MAPLPPAAQRPPVLANVRFQEHVAHLAGRRPAEIFRYIHDTELWRSGESGSGPGSELAATVTLRREIPALLRRIRARTLLDAPCGDFSWLHFADLARIDYIGADIVPALIEADAARYAGPRRRFVTLDLISDPLPRVDVVLCRDGLVHLNYPQIFAVFHNLKTSRSRYLLTTTFTELDANSDVDTGDWRPLNLCLPPFRLPEPETVIMEGCTEVGGAYADKALGLWRITDLPSGPRR
jgi:hypothetical protein